MATVISVLGLVYVVAAVVNPQTPPGPSDSKRVSIAVIGDSTGFRVVRELYGILNCQPRQNENPKDGRSPNKAYWSKGGWWFRVLVCEI